MPYLIQLTLDNIHTNDIVHFLLHEKHVKNITLMPIGSSLPTSTPASNSHRTLITFRCSDDSLTELVSELSEVKGVGLDLPNSTIDVVNLVATKPHLVEESNNTVAKKKSKFAKRRLLTEYVYTQVLNQSKLTLDYLLFCLVGAILAGVGLATDNSVTIVASMLVSPLMGPILGLTLGCIVRSKTLLIKSIKSELTGCLLVLLTGAIMGILLSPFGGPYALGFPTFQMLNRGSVEGIIFGIIIAFVSGIGVALAVSHGSINSLVGVAISAALLPPIVNTGLLFTYALFSSFMPHVKVYKNLRTSNIGTDLNEYTVGDYFTISGISFLIFVLNFVLIFATSLVIFRLKEFAPMKKQSQLWSDFQSMREHPSTPSSDAEVVIGGSELHFNEPRPPPLSPMMSILNSVPQTIPISALTPIEMNISNSQQDPNANNKVQLSKSKSQPVFARNKEHTAVILSSSSNSTQ